MNYTYFRYSTILTITLFFKLTHTIQVPQSDVKTLKSQAAMRLLKQLADSDNNPINCWHILQTPELEVISPQVYKETLSEVAHHFKKYRDCYSDHHFDNLTLTAEREKISNIALALFPLLVREKNAIFNNSSTKIIDEVMELKDHQSKLRWRLANLCIKDKRSPFSDKNRKDLCLNLLNVEQDQKRIHALRSIIEKINEKEQKEEESKILALLQKCLKFSIDGCGQCKDCLEKSIQNRT